MTPETRNSYERLLTEDYSFVTVSDSGEVRKRTLNLKTSTQPVADFNECITDWLVELIGLATIYGFEPVTLYWCYERERGEYCGGHKYSSIQELCDHYHWWIKQ